MEEKSRGRSDAAATASALPVEVAAQLANLQQQVTAIAAVVGATPSSTPPAASAPVVTAPPSAPIGSAPVSPLQPSAAETMAAAPSWRDEASYSLAPSEGIEVKLAMQAGQAAQFEWTANGAVLNYDTHRDGGGQSASYEQGRGVADQTGELTAQFTGNHGWFFRNRTSEPVTVTLRTRGEYSEMRRP